MEGFPQTIKPKGCCFIWKKEAFVAFFQAIRRFFPIDFASDSRDCLEAFAERDLFPCEGAGLALKLLGCFRILEIGGH